RPSISAAVPGGWSPHWSRAACPRWASTCRRSRSGSAGGGGRRWCAATCSPPCPPRAAGTTSCWPTATSASAATRCGCSAAPRTAPEPAYGRPAALWKALERHRPPLPRFRSPLRGPWLTSVLAAVLLVGLPIVVLTGLLDRVAYGSAPIPADVGLLQLPPFDW